MKQDNDCPLCGIDFDDIYDACAECGFNPYSKQQTMATIENPLKT